MKKQISKWLSILLPILLGVFLIVYSYNKFTPEQIIEIKSYFKNADYSYIYMGLVVAFLGNASRAYRWKFTLEHMGYSTSFFNNFMAVNIGYLLNLTVPKSGEISRALIVKKYENVPFDKGFGSIVAERIIDMLVLLFFMALAVFLQFDIVKSFILDKIPFRKLLFFGVLSFSIFAILLLIYFYSKAKWVQTIKQKISGLKEGVFSILHMEKKVEYLLHTAFIWFSYLFTFYITLFVIPETSDLSIGAIMTAFVVGSIAISFTNSGFGSYPFLISKILLFYAVSETAGSAFGWIVWTSQMLLVLVVGALSFLFLPIFNRKK
ncbi:lysylphosphatidylglycerol synthase transmembrane domain-containing protein [Flavobacterium psychrotolerans]|uniref:TIGR00374 family protein n=1 Tax=Flavobacterium psychrotolerans TaxID=2169410 RepID=A0A2U1JJB1_9FLAO|nr:lysylphosphatidylglycerol synthase transmembrane domain-containing protein [Flavobacterium psychrotolerans]PWA05227.1 TIGR00374 family protein [Flavobacterium psychrotolerans]